MQYTASLLGESDIIPVPKLIAKFNDEKVEARSSTPMQEVGTAIEHDNIIDYTTVFSQEGLSQWQLCRL